MKKIALILSLSVFTLGSVSLINSSKTFAAFPISQTQANVNEQNQVKMAEELAQTTATTTTAATKVKAEKKQNFFSKMTSKLGGKSQWVAAILCWLIGVLGVHRFYLGYTWQGIVQLLTLGACGIWTLIDLIRILIGDLEPKDGSYDSTI